MMQEGTDYGVKVVRAFEFRRVGEVFYPPGVLRSHLIQCGFVEPVRAPDAAVVTPRRKKGVVEK